ncbi:MAG: autotransporter-associated beta strand repeat-containing protein [Verrucomicrobia bacterium]|nr:autotransporter-associated beta strand repeat-containing protein [Verrucomicrobiota bacterium]
MKPKTNIRNLATVAALVVTCCTGSAADMYYKSTTAGNAWTGAFWGNASGGPYDQSWVSGSTAIFEDNSGTALALTGATTDVAGITANESVTVTASGTLGTGGTVATINVASGKTLNFQGQALSLAAGTGFVKTGPGTLSWNGSTYPGGFTLSEGTFAAGGVNAFGSGGPLVIAGGTTIRSTSATARDFSNKPSAVTIDGDFTWGDTTSNGALTFNAPVDLGSATRSLTMLSAGTLNGGISGDPGAGLTKLGAGTLTLGGVNTYDGTTTVTDGMLVFQKRASLYNGDVAEWNGTNIAVSGTGSLGFGMGGTGEFTSADIASLSAFTPTLGITTAGGNATISDVVTGGAFTKLGGNTLTLSGSNTFTGKATVTGGYLQVPSIGNAGANSPLGTNGTIDITVGTGGLIYTGTGETSDKVINYNSASGGGILTNNGTGTLVFGNPFTTTATAAFGVTFNGFGSTTISGIASPQPMNLSKQGVGVLEIAGQVVTKYTSPNGNIRADGGILRFASTAVTGSGADAGGVNRNAAANAGVLQIASGAQVYTNTANTNGILGGWATYGGTTWAVTNGTTTPISGLATFTNDTWASANNTDVTTSSAAASDSATNSLRFNTAGANTVTLAGTNRLVSGGLLVTGNVGANASTLTGGRLSTATANGIIALHQHNTAGSLSIVTTLGGPTLSSTTTNTSKIVTLASTTGLFAGMSVTGTGIAANTTISTVDSATQITLSANATASATNNLAYGNGFGVAIAGGGTVVYTTNHSYTGATQIHEGALNYETNHSLSGALNINRGTANIKLGTTLTEGGQTINFNASGASIGTYGTGTTATINTYDVNSIDFTVAAGVKNASIAPAVTVLTATYGTRFVVNADASLTMNGIISGTGKAGGILSSGTMVGTDSTAIYYQGAGNLILTGANTFSGGASNVAITSVQAGTLTLSGGDNRLPSGTGVYLGATTNTSGRLVLDGVNQTLTGLNQIGTGTANAVVGGNATGSSLTINNTNNYTFGGQIGGGGANENNLAITKAGSGVMTLTGANTYTGGTTVNGGTLRIANATGLGTGTGTVAVNSGGTLDGTGSVGSIVVSATGGTVAGGNSGTGTLAAASLTFDGDGTVVLTPGAGTLAVTNTLTASGASGSVSINIGTTPLAAGTYPVITHSGAIGGTGLSAFKMGTTPGGPFTYTLVDSAGTLSLQVATSAIFWSGGIDSDWSTTKQNWAVSSVPVYYANGNDVVFDDSATLFAVDINAADVSPGSVTFSNSANDYTVGGTKGIAGATGLLKGGSGYLTLSNTNSFSGTVTINQGTLEFASITNTGTNSSLGSGSDVVLGGGTLTYLGVTPATTDRAFTVNSNSSLDLVTSDLTITGFVDGPGGLTKKGAGTLVLDNAGNTISGTLAVTGGAVQVDDVAKLGAGSLSLGGGTLKLTGTTAMSVTKVVALTTGGGTIQVDNSAGATFSGSPNCITGTGGLTKTGTGTMTISNNGNFSGGVTVDGGTLRINAGGWYTNPFGQPNAITINPGGKIQTGGTHSLGVDQNTLHINGGTLELAAENYISNLQMTGGVVTGGQMRTWGGTMTFNASATGALIESPTFQLVGAATLSVADGDAADDLTVSSGFFGSVALTKAGDGKLVLKGQNIHTGNTVANAGTLELAKDAKLTFVLGATSGTTNKLTGAGTVVVNGNFAINTTAAAALTAGTWVLEDVTSLTGAYGSDFKATDPDGTVWANSGDVWTKSVGAQTWTFDEATGTLTLTQSGYDSWASQIPNAADRDRGDDPDSDGFTNLQEYLFGTSPIAANGSLATSERSGGTLTIRWKQRTSGASYQLKQSATLNADWTNASATPTTDGAASGDYQPMKADIAIGSGKLFFRIESVEN